MDHNAEILEFLQGVRDQLLGPAAAPELTAAATALNGAPAVPLPTVAAFWHALGFPADPADRAVTAADLQAIDQLRDLVTEGLVDEQLALSMTRAVARTADRLSVWQTQLVAESLAPATTRLTRTSTSTPPARWLCGWPRLPTGWSRCSPMPGGVTSSAP